MDEVTLLSDAATKRFEIMYPKTDENGKIVEPKSGKKRDIEESLKAFDVMEVG